MKTEIDLRGVRVLPGWFDLDAQKALVEDLRAVASAAPFVQPVTPQGKQMSVRMTSAGEYGWITDRSGYRYAEKHPSGVAWPPIPDALLALWRAVSEYDRDPECCLVNYYGEGARMGLHQDNDEADFAAPWCRCH